MRVLVVEDHRKTSALIARGLREHAYAVDEAATGTDGVWRGMTHDYDVMIVDVMLPDIDGFAVLRELRASGRWAPVLMLTARASVPDRVHGLDSGADDYLVKPFSFGELLARVRALTRRGTRPRPATLAVGDLTLDPATRAVHRGTAPVRLTAKEFALLEILARRADQVVPRADLLARCWDDAFDGDSNVLDVYIRYLREKIDRPFGRQSIETVRGVGYRLRSGGEPCD
jgi:two-component system, OmpR family, response regulator